MTTEQMTKDQLIREVRRLRRKVARLAASEAVQRRFSDHLLPRMETLALLNSLNEAVNRGEKQDQILRLFARRVKKLFRCHGAAVSLLSDDKKNLVMQKTYLSRGKKGAIEKLIGKKIPTRMEIPLNSRSRYRRVLESGGPLVVNDLRSIHAYVREFTANKRIRKLAPAIVRLLGIRSLIHIPLTANGEPIGLVVISKDRPFAASEVARIGIVAQQVSLILIQIRYHRELKESRARYQSLVNDSILGIYQTTPDGRILVANPAIVKMLGYDSFEGLAARNLEKEGYEPEYPRSGFKRKLEKEGRVIGWESAWIRRDGTVLYVRENARLVRDEQGKPLRYEGTVEDITKKKKLEERLGYETNLFRALMDHIPDDIYFKDRESRFVRVNMASVRTLGATSSEAAVGQSDADYLPDIARETRRHERQIMKTGRAMVGQPFMMRYADGTDHWVSVTKVPLHDTSGQVIGIVGISREITKEKEMENALKVSEKRYRLLFEQNLAAVYRTTLDGRILDCNQSFATLLGYDTVSEVRKHRCQEFYFDKVDRHKFIDQLQKQGVLSNCEIRLRRKDGNSVWILENVVLLQEDGDAGPIVQGTSIDITERKRAIEELYEREQKYRTLFDGSLHPITIYDRNANIVMLNKVGVKNLNRPLQEIIGRSLKEFIPDAYQLTVKRIRQVLETGAPLFVEEEISLPEGKRWFLSTLHPVSNPKGQSQQVQVISHDITERKLAEEALEHQRDVAIAMLSAGDLVEAANRLFDNVLKIEGCDCAGFYLVDKDTGKLDMIAHRGLPKRFVEKVSHLDVDSPYTKLVMEGKPIYQKTSHFPPTIREDLQSDGILFVAAVPIQYNGEIIADLNIASRTCNRISVSTRQILESVAAQIGETIVRAKMKDALRISEENYRSLVEKMPDVIYSLDKKGNITSINKAVKSILGIEPEKIIGRNFGEFIEKGMTHQTMRQFRQVLRGKGTNIEIAMMDKNGKLHDVEFSSTPIIKRGKIVGSQGIVRDITERKRAEEEIYQLSQFRESVIETANVWLDVLDEKANVVLWNKVAEQISGYSREEVVGHGKIWEWLYPDEDYRHQITTKAAAIIEKGEVVEDFETTIRCKDGQTKIISWNSRNLRDEKGNVFGSIALGRDITGRKRAEEELIRLSTAMKRSNDSIVICDIDANIIDVNEATLTMYGTKNKKDLVGKSSFELIVPEDREKALIAVKEVQEKGYVSAQEYRIMTKDGCQIPVEMSSAVMKNAAGKPIGFVGISRDITARKRAEKILQQSEERYRSLFENSPISIWEEDFSPVKKYLDRLQAKGVKDFRKYFREHQKAIVHCVSKIKVVDTNKASLKLFQANSKEELRLGLRDTFTKESYDAFLEELVSIGEGETQFATETKTKTLKGKEKHIVIRWSIAPGCEKTLAKVLVSIDDITERKQAEKLLQESEEKFSKAFHSGSNVMAITTIKEGRVVDVNEAYCRLAGYKCEELIGHTTAELNVWSDPEMRERIIQKLQKEGRVANLEVKQRTKSGEIRTLIYSGDIITLNNENFLLNVAMDITERKQAEELLRTSEAQLSNAMKIAKLGYWEYDVADDLFTFNDHFYAIFRTNAAQVGGYKMSSARYAQLFVHPDDVSVIGGEIRTVLETSDPHFSRQLEHRMVYADGEIGYIAVRYFIVKDDRGRTVKTYGANQDITERKRIEEALREQAEKREELEHIVNRSPAVIFLWRAAEGWPVEYVSDNVQHLFGYSPEDFCSGGILYADTVHPDDVRRVTAEIAQYSNEQGCESFSQEYRIITSSGDVRWLDDRTWIRRNEEGEITHYQGIILDISDRKQTQRALVRSENRLRSTLIRLRSTLESMEDLVFVFDRQTRFTDYYAPPRELYMLPESFIGKKCTQVMPPEISSSFEKAFSKNRVGHTDEFEYQLDIDSREKWFAAKISPMLLDNEFMGSVAVVRDITGRKLADEKIKAALQEKELLLREIHHRVKNNLQVISSLINFQTRYIRDKLSIASFKELQNRIRSMSLIHEKLYQSKDLAHVNFQLYIEDLANALCRSYGTDQNRIRIAIEVTDFAPRIEFAIPLGLIINELVSNALKHAFPDGRKGHICLGLSTTEKHVELKIEDDGIGMPKKIDPRGAETLGLQLVMLLAEDQLHGSVDIAAANGTRVTVDIPLR